MRKSNYSIFEKIENIYSLFKTKVIYPTARLIRFPFFVRGKRYIDFGKNLTTGRNCRIDVNGKHNTKVLVFGKNVNIGDNVRISALENIDIGDNVLMGSRVLIIDNCHGSYKGESHDSPNVPPNERVLVSQPVKIGDNVWIGENVVIQMGVTIGSGSIIGANSVVTKNIPSNCIAAGIPANVIKKYRYETKEWERISL